MDIEHVMSRKGFFGVERGEKVGRGARRKKDERRKKKVREEISVSDLDSDSNSNLDSDPNWPLQNNQLTVSVPVLVSVQMISR